MNIITCVACEDVFENKHQCDSEALQCFCHIRTHISKCVKNFSRTQHGMWQYNKTWQSAGSSNTDQLQPITAT